MKGLKVLLVVLMAIYIGLIITTLTGRTTMDGITSNIVICSVVSGTSYLLMRATISED